MLQVNETVTEDKFQQIANLKVQNKYLKTQLDIVTTQLKLLYQVIKTFQCYATSKKALTGDAPNSRSKS